MNKLAVLIIHGIEVDDSGMFDTALRLLQEQFSASAQGAPAGTLVVETVNWASVLEGAEKGFLARQGTPDAEGYWKSLYDGVRAVTSCELLNGLSN